MQNMWAHYFKEREGYETIETQVGCAAYKIEGTDCYIKEIFIMPAFRRSGEAFKIGDMIADIARINGCTHLTGSVVPSLPGSSESLMGLLKYGFKLVSSQNNFIVLAKEI